MIRLRTSQFCFWPPPLYKGDIKEITKKVKELKLEYSKTADYVSEEMTFKTAAIKRNSLDGMKRKWILKNSKNILKIKYIILIELSKVTKY